MKPAVFLDRDGVINVDVNYLSRPEDVRLIPGAARAIAKLNAAGFAVVVVSNQSGLARGYFGPEDLEAVRAELDRRLAQAGARVDAYYHCPHHPDQGVIPELTRACDCRKPAPGMVLRAARELNLDLAASFMVGDKPSDAACGRAAGVVSILVGGASGGDAAPDHMAADLAQAVDWILGRAGEGGA